MNLINRKEMNAAVRSTEYKFIALRLDHVRGIVWDNKSKVARNNSLLVITLEGDGHRLSKHNHRASFHDSHASQTLAVVKLVTHEISQRLKHNFSHLIGLQVRRVVHFGTSRVF